MSEKPRGPVQGLLSRKRTMLRAARNRAKTKGVPFNITINDFQIPEVCPALGIEISLDGTQRDNSPSLDRIMPPMGYVKGNVMVISNRANRIKNNASAHELRAIADFLENHIKDEWMKHD